MCSTVVNNYLLEIPQDKLETVRNMIITKDESYVYDLDPETKPHEGKKGAQQCRCFGKWEYHWKRLVLSKGEYFEGHRLH